MCVATLLSSCNCPSCFVDKIYILIHIYAQCTPEAKTSHVTYLLKKTHDLLGRLDVAAAVLRKGVLINWFIKGWVPTFSSEWEFQAKAPIG